MLYFGAPSRNSIRDWTINDPRIDYLRTDHYETNFSRNVCNYAADMPSVAIKSLIQRYEFRDIQTIAAYT